VRLAAVNTEVTLRQIELFLALGGGWQEGHASAQQWRHIESPRRWGLGYGHSSNSRQPQASKKER